MNNIVMPAGGSQVVWAKWHTPMEPTVLTIQAAVSGASIAKTSFTAQIVSLEENLPPDPMATDVNPRFSLPSLPSNPQKTSASLSGSMEIHPDDIVPTAQGDNMKSGYGIKEAATVRFSANAPLSHYAPAQTGVSYFPEFSYQDYWRLLSCILVLLHMGLQSLCRRERHEHILFAPYIFWGSFLYILLMLPT